MKVEIHLYTQSKPVVVERVRNAYEKGSFYCVMTFPGKVYKFPIQHIWRVTEEEV